MMRMAAASDMMYMKVVGMVMVGCFIKIIFLLALMMIPRTTLMETKTEQQQKVERNLG